MLFSFLLLPKILIRTLSIKIKATRAKNNAKKLLQFLFTILYLWKVVTPIQVCCLSFVTTEFLISFSRFFILLLIFFFFQIIEVHFREKNIIKGRRFMKLMMIVCMSLFLGQVLSKNTYSFSHNEQYKPLRESITSGRKTWSWLKKKRVVYIKHSLWLISIPF